MKPYGSLDNYISTLRAAAGLTQDELAVLLELESGASIDRYEGGRAPELRKIIALEVVFDEPMQWIFAGIADVVRARVAARARALLENTTDKMTAENAQKLETLGRLARVDEEDFMLWERHD